MKLNELTQQVTLLGRNHIGTDEQLLLYKQKVESKIETLIADRAHLRNEIRKINITDERLSQAKEQIADISKCLKELRKEVKLCNGIAERSVVIAQNI